MDTNKPNKNGVGKINKIILEEINSELLTILHLI